jgi:P27 family predicted phage terminase small subunit
MAGRPRKPTAQLRLAGTLRADRVKKQGRATEPTPKVALPKPPAGMSAAALAEYRRVGVLLVRERVLTELDRNALATYADAVADYASARKRIKARGWFTATGEQPAVRAMREAAERINRLGQQLGLTPSSRSKVAAAPKPSERESTAARFFGGTA